MNCFTTQSPSTTITQTMSSYSIPVYLTQIPNDFGIADINHVFKDHGIIFQDIQFNKRMAWKYGYKYGFGTLQLPDMPTPGSIRLHSILMQNHELEWNIHEDTKPLKIALCQPRWKRAKTAAAAAAAPPLPEWMQNGPAPDDFLCVNDTPVWISHLLNE